MSMFWLINPVWVDISWMEVGKGLMVESKINQSMPQAGYTELVLIISICNKSRVYRVWSLNYDFLRGCAVTSINVLLYSQHSEASSFLRCLFHIWPCFPKEEWGCKWMQAMGMVVGNHNFPCRNLPMDGATMVYCSLVPCPGCTLTPLALARSHSPLCNHHVLPKSIMVFPEMEEAHATNHRELQQEFTSSNA